MKNLLSSVRLSEHAEERMRELRFRFFKWQGVVALVALLVILCLMGFRLLDFLFGYSGTEPSWSIIGKIALISGILVGTCYAIMLAFLPVYFKKRRKALEANVKDREQAVRLSSMFSQLIAPPLHSYPVAEPLIPGTWRVFRIEHYASRVLRGEFTANINLGNVLFGAGSGFGGSMFQVSMANLIDTSTLMFVKDDTGRTQRLIVPSPNTVMTFFGGWIGVVTNKLTCKSYAWKAVGDFNYHDWLQVPLQKAAVIDGLDAQLETGEGARTPLEVFGQEVQPGVVVVSQLIVDGKKVICFPTGFFQTFAQQIATEVNAYLQIPQISNATS